MASWYLLGFTRPRFELGLSSRAPQVSASRVRLSCSIESQVFWFMRHDVLNVGRSTAHLSSSPLAPVVITLDVFNDSLMDSSHVVWQLHLSSFGRGFLELFGTCARSVTTALHGNLEYHKLFGAEPLSLLPFKRLEEPSTWT